MFSKLTRTALILLSLVATAGAAIGRSYFVAGAFALVVVLLIYGHLRYGTIWTAFQAYRRGSLDGVAARLAEIRHPRYLEPRSRAYYELLRGVIAHRDGALDDARRHLTSALERGMRTTHMVAVVRMHLADIALQSGDRKTALEHLDGARAAPHQPALDAALDKLADDARGE